MSTTRYELTIPLTTVSPLHSGGVDVIADPEREGVDREAIATAFARDAHGRPVLTGRSVKGAVRAACARYLREQEDCDLARTLRGAEGSLWGDTGQKRPDAAPLRASALTFHDIEIHAEALAGTSTEEVPETGQQGGPALPSRVGIAMNRYWGAVGDGALFVHEFVPRDTALTLVITAEGVDEAPAPRAGTQGAANSGDASQERRPEAPPRPATAAEVKSLLELIVGLLRAGRIAFGGRQGAGWGRVVLDESRPWHLRELSPGTRQGLRALLSGSLAPSADLEPVSCPPDRRIRVTVSWTSPTGILVADPGLSRQDKADLKQRREAALAKGTSIDDDPVPTVPLRADGSTDGPLVLPGSSVRGALRSRASRIARTVLVGAWNQQLDDWSASHMRVHDQLAADPVLVRDLFGTTEHRGAVTVLDTQAAPSPQPRTITHNAGDRWTGGVAEGALYSEVVHDDAAWDEIVLEVDPDRLPKGLSRRRAAWCLLGLVLAELSTGTLPLGSRGTRGLGQVAVTGLTVEGLEHLELPDAAWSFTAGEGQGGREVAEALLEHLRAVNQMIEPKDGTDATGWSSYLIETEEDANA